MNQVTSHITEPGIYEMNTNSPTDIQISGQEVVIIDQTRGALQRSITISGTATIYGWIDEDADYDLHVTTDTPEAHSEIRYLLTCRETRQITKILSQVSASNARTNVHILALIADGGIIELDGTIQIDAGIESVGGHILEENIFLGSTWQVKWIPSLLVRSNDVEAGHAARIERVPDEKLYYLRSRGIPQDDATVMMIRNAVNILYDGLEEGVRDEVIQKSLQKVLA